MTVRDIIELHKLGYTKQEIDEMRMEEKSDAVEDSEGSDSAGCDSGVCDLGVGSNRDFIGDKIADAVKPIQDAIGKMQDSMAHAPVAETDSGPQPTTDDILASWIGGTADVTT